MSEWKECKLGDVIALQRGHDLPRNQMKEGDIPVAGSNGIIGYHNKSTTRPPGITIGRSGNLGNAFFYRKDFWAHNTTLYVILLQDFKGNDAVFIYYFLKTFDFNQFNVGSAVPTLNRNHVYPLAVNLPPFPEQKAIASVLSSLDDKIELNRRRNETLEAMARALFKSWFVDFDPVRAKIAGRDPGLPQHLADLFPDRLVDSELGEIPDGWKVKALSCFGAIVTGKTPSTKEPEHFGDDVPFLRIPDMHGKIYVLQTQMMLSSHGASSQPKKTLPSGSVSVSCIATLGLVVLNHRATQTNQQINSIIPRNQSLSRYTYWSCRQLSSDIKIGGIGGSVFGNMNKSTFGSLPVLDAQPAAIHAFDQLASPMHDTILSNEIQNLILAHIRNTLLPKLISGELRVKDAKKQADAIA